MSDQLRVVKPDPMAEVAKKVTQSGISGVAPGVGRFIDFDPNVQSVEAEVNNRALAASADSATSRVNAARTLFEGALWITGGIAFGWCISALVGKIFRR